MPTIILYNPKEKVKFKVPYLPFSLMAIGSELKKAGYAVRIIDARVEKDSKGLLRAALMEDVLFVGITLITGSVIYDALEAAKLARENRPGVRIVLGGVHSSLLPEEVLKSRYVDAVVIGPGEETVVELARAFERDEPVGSIGGLAYKSDGKATINSRTARFDKDKYSGIDFGMVDLARYIKREASGERCLDYLSSRGCPHPCTYCAISKMWNKQIIYYPAEKMVDDIDGFIKRLNIDGIHFLDDNFFVNRNRVEAFCDEIIRRGLKISFWSMCRCNYFSKFDEEFILKLKKAGFHTINFGAESGSQFILDKIKKGITVEQILESAKKCDRYGFRGQFSFMMGFPFEKDEDFDMTMGMIDAIHSINPAFDIQLFPFTPFPQTDLALECSKYGYRPPDKLEDWARFEFGSISMPWLSKARKNRNSTLTTIAWFAFTTETAIKMGGIQGFLFRLFGKLARLRWKHRAFRFPIEWKLINFFARFA